MKKFIGIWLCVLLALSCNKNVNKYTVLLVTDRQIPELQFGMDELRRTGDVAGMNFVSEPDPGTVVINFNLDESLGKEVYQIEQSGRTIQVKGGDANGLMYAGLELAENIQDGKDLLELGSISGKPYMPHRGIKFNFPLDARTPSYDDTGDAAQSNIGTMWEFDFWKNYLDNMARYRYNVLSLWSLHPYPSMVKIPGMEDLALEDVCIYTNPVTATIDRDWGGQDIQDPKKLKVIKKMTIDEKIAFWKKVFQYADDRGIDIHMFHWNVYVNGVEGKHGIEWRQDCEATIDYTRKSVKQFLLTYPNIKGIGVTAGEHLDRKIVGKYSIENWLWLTFGKGVLEAKAEKPELNPTFIFRQHQSDLDLIKTAFKDYPGPFDTEFKYSRARMFSSTKPPWFDHIYRDQVKKYNMKIWMNVRNDDILNFRWGNPEYASEYIRNMPRELMQGYLWGPDGYIYGRVFNSKNADKLPPYEIDKQWYMFMIYGRAGYDPDLPQSFYVNRIKHHFPGVDARKLYDTWKSTSEVISWVDKIHFRQNDFEFLPEGSMDGVKFHDINSFCRVPCMPEQGVSSIGDFVINGKAQGEMTPFEVADKMEKAYTNLMQARNIKNPGNAELEQTLGDLVALGYLSKYYACKIQAATYLSQYRYAGDEENKNKAVAELESALEAWKDYAQTATTYYNPQLLARSQKLDWVVLTGNVENDITIAKEAKVGEPVEVSGSNILWRVNRKFQ
jgi:hypothetical protein